MSSEARRTSSDSAEAYARAVLREEKRQEREQLQLNEVRNQESCDVDEADEASDLFRQHSHQQSMEGG